MPIRTHVTGVFSARVMTAGASMIPPMSAAPSNSGRAALPARTAPLVPAQYTNYESASVGFEDQSQDGIAMLGTRLETQLWSGVEFDLSWQSYLALTNLDRT
jgi:hypothetical protein